MRHERPSSPRQTARQPGRDDPDGPARWSSGRTACRPPATRRTDDESGERNVTDLVEQPAKVMRIGRMIRQLLEEVKSAPARRGRAGPGSRASTSVDQGAQGRASPPSSSRSSTGCRCRSDSDTPSRVRAADRPGPAGRLARGPVPRHPDRDLRPADGRPRPARADAPGAAGRHAPRRGTAAAPRSAGTGPVSPTSRATGAACTSDPGGRAAAGRGPLRPLRGPVAAGGSSSPAR